jgi:hypothetical protein
MADAESSSLQLKRGRRVNSIDKCFQPKMPPSPLFYGVWDAAVTFGYSRWMTCTLCWKLFLDLGRQSWPHWQCLYYGHCRSRDIAGKQWHFRSWRYRVHKKILLAPCVVFLFLSVGCSLVTRDARETCVRVTRRHIPFPAWQDTTIRYCPRLYQRSNVYKLQPLSEPDNREFWKFADSIGNIM